MIRIYRRFLQELQNFLYNIRTYFSGIKPKVEHDLPFVCQFAHPEHAELSLKRELNPKDDKHWSDTGASSPERYAEWAFTMCGMASTSMALGHFKGETKMPVELAEDALSHGVYHEEKDGTLSSMQYREFADWVKKHGLTATALSRLTIRGIQFALSSEKLVIVSVNPNIREYETAPCDQKGGHLVVVTGYDVNEKTISINNPSGFVSNNTQINHRIPLDTFCKHYAGRGIVLSNDN